MGPNKKLPPVKSAVEHLIETTAARPVSSSYRGLDPERLAAAKVELAAQESQVYNMYLLMYCTLYNC